jgi:DNA-directed RNA polymerase specialized sigma24 family protein
MSTDQDRDSAGVPPSQGSVALAIAQYQSGDGAELGEIIKAYFAQLLTKARVGVGRFPHSDPEGLAQSAIKSFLQRAKDGKFPELRHRNELVPLLCTIVRRKVAHEFRDQSTEKAGGGNVRNEPEQGLEVESRESDPVEEANCKEWLDFMRANGLEHEARLIFEGYHYHEIAKKLGSTEAKARRAITRVHKLTEVFFGLEE